MKKIMFSLMILGIVLAPTDTAMAQEWKSDGPINLKETTYLGLDFGTPTIIGGKILRAVPKNNTQIWLNKGSKQWTMLPNGAIVLKSDPKYGLTVQDQKIANGSKIVLHVGHNFWKVLSNGAIVLKNNPAFGLTVQNLEIMRFKKSGPGNFPVENHNRTRIILHQRYNAWTRDNNWKFVRIPAGEFQMGSPIPAGKVKVIKRRLVSSRENERPSHSVKISKEFWMQTTEVTHLQFLAVRGFKTAYSRNTDCLDCPVETISWDSAQKFIAELNEQKDGYKYRLPTEAEWEYAARAGTTGPWAGYLDSMAWYKQWNKPTIANPKRVGQKSPNAWGLYDMHGNVAEWVQDYYYFYFREAEVDPTGPPSGTERVIRGGHIWSKALEVRSASRTAKQPSTLHSQVGFRIVRTPDN